MNEQYVARVEEVLDKLAPLVVERAVSVRQPTDSVLVIRVDLRFLDGARFEGNEIWAGGRRKYRFHLMDSKGALVWRLDNAPHHPEVRTHPHHRHAPGERVEESPPVTLEEALLLLGRSEMRR